MPFQGFSFVAMALVGIGVMAYHFYRHREQYFSSPHQTYATRPALDQSNECTYWEPELSEDCSASVRRRHVQETEDLNICSICMEHIEVEQFNYGRFRHDCAVRLSCDHVFHRSCLADWKRKGAYNCPNCRASL